MKVKFTVRGALEATGGKYKGPEEALDKGVFEVITDSRQASEGSLFVAIKGERTDGHDYISSVYEKGGVCCICEREIETGCPCIIVESSVEALQRLAAWYRGQLGVKVVGITGSVGKTTCKEVLASVLGVKFNVHKTRGNFNNEIGLPLTLLAMPLETQAAVIEMGMSGFGEMRLLSSIARPDMCVITNIGHSHIGILGSQEGIFKAKSEIFEYMAQDAPAFLNGDDKFLRTVSRKNLHLFGFGEENEIQAQDVEDRGLMGTRCTVRIGGKKLKCSVSIPGRHVLYAVMAAIGAGKELGLTESEILEGIEKASTIGGRVNLIERGGVKIIDDCYNAAPASMMAALDLLSGEKGEKLAVLGDIGELGDCAPELHAQVGEYAAKKNISLVICVGELAKNISEACTKNGGNSLWLPNITELEKSLPKILPKSCTVLVKASHFMEFPKVVEMIKKLAL